MSNIGLIIEERPRDIGNFLVGRLLPFYGKRMVGPFIFLDHMGPVAMNDHQNVDVPPHPHIGLSTSPTSSRAASATATRWGPMWRSRPAR